MGDRLTLETAAEITGWFAIVAAKCAELGVSLLDAETFADMAVRACRERLPKVSTLLGDLEPGVAAGIGDAMGGLIDSEREERESDIPRDYITAREQLPRLVGAILNPNGEQEAYCLDSVGMMSSVDACIREVERLQGPTEGASDAGVWEKRSRAYRKCADAFQAERNEVEDRLGTLIGAVEDAIDIEHETPVVTIRAALDAAKGVGLGVTVKNELPVEVYLSVKPHEALRFDCPGPEPVDAPGLRWGGRCTRGAPDDGLRARVEAALTWFEEDDSPAIADEITGEDLAGRLRRELGR